MEKQVLVLYDGITLLTEAVVTVLGVTIDDNLNFNENISVCCTKADLLLNALARIATYLDVRSHRTIYNSLIMSNLTIVPWWGIFMKKKPNSKKLEKIQEWALRILYDDSISTNDEHLEKAGTNTLFINRLRLMSSTAFKSLSSLNPPCLIDIFSKNCHIWCVAHV